jgi:hypothetical protein
VESRSPQSSPPMLPSLLQALTGGRRPSHFLRLIEQILVGDENAVGLMGTPEVEELYYSTEDATGKTKKTLPAKIRVKFYLYEFQEQTVENKNNEFQESTDTNKNWWKRRQIVGMTQGESHHQKQIYHKDKESKFQLNLVETPEYVELEIGGKSGGGVKTVAETHKRLRYAQSVRNRHWVCALGVLIAFFATIGRRREGCEGISGSVCDYFCFCLEFGLGMACFLAGLMGDYVFLGTETNAKNQLEAAQGAISGLDFLLYFSPPTMITHGVHNGLVFYATK